MQYHEKMKNVMSKELLSNNYVDSKDPEQPTLLLSTCSIQDKRAKMALYCSPDYQKSFKLIGISVQEKKFYIDFQDGGHLGFKIKRFSFFFFFFFFSSTHHFDTTNKVLS